MQVGVSVPEETVVRLRKLKPEKQSLSSFIKELMDLGLESYEISSFSPDAAAEVTPAMEELPGHKVIVTGAESPDARKQKMAKAKEVLKQAEGKFNLAESLKKAHDAL